MKPVIPKRTVAPVPDRPGQPTWYIPEAWGTIRDMKFFESGPLGPDGSRGKRGYRWDFRRDEVQVINWELEIEHSRYVIIEYELTYVWYKDGIEWRRRTTAISNYGNSPHYPYDGMGYIYFGSFPAGKYDVEIYSDGVLVALSSFIVED